MLSDGNRVSEYCDTDFRLVILSQPDTIWDYSMTTNREKCMLKPEEHLGFKVGDDRKLAGWEEIITYFRTLGELSERVVTVEIGRSTKDNPFLMSIISSPENLASLEEYRNLQGKLADPRTVSDENEAKNLIERGRAVVAITCSIHATEVGATQMSLLLAHHLAANQSPLVREILDNVILLLVPCANPDGLIDVKAWYESTLGESYEGVMPPFLYQHYTGHDNNRDWFMFTQQETRLLVDHCFNAWRPHVVLDMHQTRSNGVRLMVPPFVNPMGPNVDAILNAESAMLGAAMAADLTAEGKAGVAMNVVYDAYSPNRSYQQYHGGVRMLTEAAGARIATPVKVPERDLQSDRGETPKQVTWNHPMPWKGGTWSLRDIVDYDLSAAVSCLRHAARLRETLLRNFYQVGLNSLEQETSSYAFVIPTQQHDHSAAAEMLDVLRIGMVEVHEVLEAFTADGQHFGAGARVILNGQPYWRYAKTLMEQQEYPEIPEQSGDLPKEPYDVTTHCLPIQMGVNTYTIKGRFAARMRLLKSDESSMPTPAVRGQRMVTGNSADCSGSWSGLCAIQPGSNDSAKIVNMLLARGTKLWRAREPFGMNGATFGVGTFIAEDAESSTGMLTDLAESPLHVLETLPDIRQFEMRSPRIGLYKSHIANAEEGWTRYVFDEYGFNYESLTNSDLQESELAERFDSIVIPHQPVHQIRRGHRESYYHPKYSGGLGEQGCGKPAGIRRTRRDTHYLGRIGPICDSPSGFAGAECTGRLAAPRFPLPWQSPRRAPGHRTPSVIWNAKTGGSDVL